jgi:hypothetical protein
MLIHRELLRIRMNVEKRPVSFIIDLSQTKTRSGILGLGEWRPCSKLLGLQDKSLLHNVNERAWHSNAGQDHILGRQPTPDVAINNRSEKWWSQTESNRRPQACKASALPTELWPRRNTHIIEARTDCKLPATSDAIHIVRKPSTDPARMNGGPGKS